MSGRDEKTDRLDSWKEIAAYLNRSVRTVRRWEKQEGLPVHRHMHQTLGSIYAYRSELDRWRRESDTARTSRARRMPAIPEVSRSVAVLPFDYVGPDREQTWIADGFTEEVISRLSSVRSLRVISRTSSRALRGTSRSAGAIGADLGVRYLVEGAVRRGADGLRVSARLIDATADDRIWSEDFDGRLDDLFAIQESLARRIVESLAVRVTSEEMRRLADPAVENVVAWECMVQARQEALRWRADSIDRAIQRLRSGLEAVGDDPKLYSALGRTHLQYREAGIDLSDEPLRQADLYAKKVFELDPGAAAAFQLRGWVRYSRGEVQGAVRDLAAALAIEWSDADTLALLGNCCLISGRVREARPLIQRLLSIDPLTPLNRCMPGWADALDGELSSAVAHYRAMYEMDPENPMARLFHAYILTLNGRSDEVVRLAAGFSTEARDGLPAKITALFAGALTGEAESAIARLPRPDDVMVRSTELFPRMIGQGLALAQRPGAAIDWLSIAVDRGFINHPFLAEHDPCLVSLRSVPRFASLLEVTRKRWLAFELPPSLIASS